MKSIVMVALGGMATLGASAAQAEHLAPRNACSKLAGADAFQMQLVTAIANRNAEMLRPLIADHITLDFGGGSGWEEMRQRLASPDYNLWEELDKVTRLGCAPSYEDSLAMPYYWSQDFGDMDAYETYIVTADSVPLFESAQGTDSTHTLAWEAVELSQVFDTSEEWEAATRWQVKTRKGKSGYVDRENLRSLVDYRLIAEPHDGDWKVTVFVAGD